MYSCTCPADAEPCDVWDEQTRRAARPHRCVECGEPIPVGSQHHYVSALSDGSWSHHRICDLCRRIADDLDCWVVGHLWEDLWESNGLRPDRAPADDDGWPRYAGHGEPRDSDRGARSEGGGGTVM
jgi:hypothetical protein